MDEFKQYGRILEIVQSKFIIHHSSKLNRTARRIKKKIKNTIKTRTRISPILILIQDYSKVFKSLPVPFGNPKCLPITLRMAFGQRIFQKSSYFCSSGTTIPFPVSSKRSYPYQSFVS